MRLDRDTEEQLRELANENPPPIIKNGYTAVRILLSEIDALRIENTEMRRKLDLILLNIPRGHQN